MNLNNKFRTLLGGCIFLLILLAVLFLEIPNVSAGSVGVNVWWPANQVTVSGVQPFKAMVSGISVDQYKMYWRVDDGSPVLMPDNYNDYPHKEAVVDLSGWSWKGNGPYTITFSAKNSDGSLIAEAKSVIYIPQKTISSNQTTQVSPATQISNPINGSVLYTDPYSAASSRVSSLRSSSRNDEASLLEKIALSPGSRWFGNWNSDVLNDVNKYVTKANSSGATPVLVAYNLPGRDCGGYSAGGTGSADQYKNWIKAFADGIGSKKAVVILEPDALAQLECLPSGDQENRVGLISYAIDVLKSKSSVAVYVDSGNPYWKSTGEMANRLKRAGVEKANGFALNVSNFVSTDENKKYGNEISSLIGGKHFVVDTSRNGSGSTGQWCNPWGRSLGIKPTTQTGESKIDAYLWIKAPGESDGYCNGGPNAGVFWDDYAFDLARNTSWR